MGNFNSTINITISNNLPYPTYNPSKSNSYINQLDFSNPFSQSQSQGLQYNTFLNPIIKDVITIDDALANGNTIQFITTILNDMGFDHKEQPTVYKVLNKAYSENSLSSSVKVDSPLGHVLQELNYRKEALFIIEKYKGQTAKCILQDMSQCISEKMRKKAQQQADKLIKIESKNKQNKHESLKLESTNTSLSKHFFKLMSESFNYIDSVFTRMLQILPGVRATDLGMIAYFEGTCPDGWSDYIEGQSRFIFGAGSGYSVGDTGGEYTHILTESEIPAHFHKIFSSGGNAGLPNYEDYISNYGWSGSGTSGINDPNSDYTIRKGSYYPILGRTSSYGGSTSHNNMPPYIVLRVCKKIKDSIVDLSSYALKSELPTFPSLNNYALKTELPIVPSLNNYALKTEVPIVPSLNKYALKSEIPIVPSLNNYALKSEIPTVPLLNKYALKSDIEKYCTENVLPTVENIKRDLKDAITTLSGVNISISDAKNRLSGLESDLSIMNCLKKDSVESLKLRLDKAEQIIYGIGVTSLVISSMGILWLIIKQCNNNPGKEQGVAQQMEISNNNESEASSNSNNRL